MRTLRDGAIRTPAQDGLLSSMAAHAWTFVTCVGPRLCCHDGCPTRGKPEANSFAGVHLYDGLGPM